MAAIQFLPLTEKVNPVVLSYKMQDVLPIVFLHGDARTQASMLIAIPFLYRRLYSDDIPLQSITMTWSMSSRSKPKLMALYFHVVIRPTFTMILPFSEYDAARYKNRTFTRLPCSRGPDYSLELRGAMLSSYMDNLVREYYYL